MADETVLNTTCQYDDAAEQQKFLEKREQQKKEDFAKPFDPECVLEVRHLRKTFPMKKTMMGKVTRELVAVDDISFKLKAGETLGIVGESGCGKTTAGRAILKLHQPTGGQIIFDGKDITNYTPRQMREIRKEMQISFQ
ncbi:MAG: ATP-binding cassette domain-containing protein, partial [Oscillospiraceae bacterium]|nr:ATP-binding cassette domain-containing protein [Oscillospiraceae bacterium]